MSKEVDVGDQVMLIGLPDWLTHDLPEDERLEIVACIGQVAVVREIDEHGYFWLGFGVTVEDAENAYFSGHSFAVTRECIVPTT